MNLALLNLKEYPMDFLINTKERLKKEGKKVYDFGVGDPKEPIEDFLVKALKEAITNQAKYPTLKGLPELKRSIKNFIKRRFNVEIKEDMIIPTYGSKEAIFHFPLSFINISEEKRGVAFFSPAYPIYERGALFSQAKVFKIVLKEENSFKPSFNSDIFYLDSLKHSKYEKIDISEKELLKQIKILWINYPHNPTGANIDKNELEKLYELALKYDFILASDECYSEIYLGKEKPISLLEVAQKENFKNAVVFNSLSKRSGFTGIRSGFVAGDKDIINFYLKWRSSFGVAPQDFVQKASILAWEDEDHVEKRRTIFRQKYNLFKQFFEKYNIPYFKSEYTFYVWIKMNKNYLNTLIENGIILQPGEFMGEGGEGYARLALVPSLKECKEAISLWESLIKKGVLK